MLPVKHSLSFTVTAFTLTTCPGHVSMPMCMCWSQAAGAHVPAEGVVPAVKIRGNTGSLSSCLPDCRCDRSSQTQCSHHVTGRNNQHDKPHKPPEPAKLSNRYRLECCIKRAMPAIIMVEVQLSQQVMRVICGLGSLDLDPGLRREAHLGIFWGLQVQCLP